MINQKPRQNYYAFQTEIKSMLYAFGDTKTPQTSTMQYLEILIKTQMKKLVILANKVKNFKKTRIMTLEDVCFVLRNNKTKVKRIISSVTYKELRKKISEEEGEDLDIDDNDTKFDWLLELNKRIYIRRKESTRITTNHENDKHKRECNKTKTGSINDNNNEVKSDGADVFKTLHMAELFAETDKEKKGGGNLVKKDRETNDFVISENCNVRQRVEHNNVNDLVVNEDVRAEGMNAEVPNHKRKKRKMDTDAYDNLENVEIFEEIDEGFKQRLKKIDDVTKKMNIQEYLEYSECRQASFTYRKNKKFEDFLNISEKIKDDVIEVLGFIAYEMVYEVVDEALTIKQENNNPGIGIGGLFGSFNETSLDISDIDEACRKILRTKKYLFL